MYEGKQFYVSSIDIVGSADPGMLNDLPLKPGRVYNVRPVDLFLQRHLRGADVNDPKIQHCLLDERKGDGSAHLRFPKQGGVNMGNFSCSLGKYRDRTD